MNKRTLRLLEISSALMLSLFAHPCSGRSVQLPKYVVTQDDGGSATLVLPRPIHYSAMAKGDRTGHHTAQPMRLTKVPVQVPGLPRVRSATIEAAEQGDVLPGLPGALVAVVENGPSITPSNLSPKALPSARRSTALSTVPVSPAPSGPVSLTATIMDDPDPALRGLFLPFEATVGAAAFSRGDDVLVVFDAARPFDLSAVQDDPVGARASIQLLPEATILRLRVPHAAGFVLRRFPAGWLIQANVPSRLDRPIAPVMEKAALRFPVEDAGKTVIVPDPQTGANLLVGTLRNGHDAIEKRRSESVAIMEQTIQGVVVDPLSDRLELRPVKGAFLLSGIGVEAVDIRSMTAALEAGTGAPTSRIMSLTAGSLEALSRQFKEAKAAAAAAPAEARFVPRLLAAQDALALGDAEAAATITRVAVADDARQATTLRPRLVLAAAALLEHHPEAVDLLDEPQTRADSESSLWRAIKLAERDPASPEAARLFAVNLPLLQSYPAPLQAALLPLAGESLVRGGTDAQAALLDRLPEGHPLAFAHALLLERQGRKQAALVALDHLSLDPELRLADMAVEAAVSIRQRSPGSDPKKLADILDGHLLDARIGGHDIASRFHVAELRAQAGQWQEALDLLRETAALYPEQKTATHRRAGQVLMRLAAAPLKPGDEAALNQAAIIETNAGMLPAGADGSRISLFLAARLSALDLPERAAPIVREMMHVAAPGVDKAELGLRLAVLDFEQNDLAGAQAALQDSDPGNLPPRLSNPRLIVMARALAGNGQLDQALVAIAPVTTDAGLDLKASLLARRGDWSGTSDTLLALARQDQPTTGRLDATGQDLLLRLASAASRSRDKARVEQVMSLGAGRFTDPGKEALFRLLVSDAVADGADPVKISSEIATLHHNPAVFDSISK